jgi:hypothetical protein
MNCSTSTVAVTVASGGAVKMKVVNTAVTTLDVRDEGYRTTWSR